LVNVKSQTYPRFEVSHTFRSRLPCWGNISALLVSTFSRQYLASYSAYGCRPVVLKVVDIDPQGSIGPSEGSINSHGVEWRSVNSQGVNE